MFVLQKPLRHVSCILFYSWLSLPCLHFNQTVQLETWWFKHHFQSVASEMFSQSPPSPCLHPLLLALPLSGPFGFWLKTNEATNKWKDRNLLALGSFFIFFAFLHGARLAQQYRRSKGCQRSCSTLHDGALHAPFPTNTLGPPPSLALPFFLSFRGHGLGQVHLQGVWIEMHWSAH